MKDSNTLEIQEIQKKIKDVTEALPNLTKTAAKRKSVEDAYNRLKKNKDFKLLIEQDYLREYSDISASHMVQDNDHSLEKNKFMRIMYGIEVFKTYLASLPFSAKQALESEQTAKNHLEDLKKALDYIHNLPEDSDENAGMV